jgi:hypothetical protein
MSIGCFVGPLRSAYAEEAQDRAALFAKAIDATLRKHGLPGYREPTEEPDVYNDGLFGRSALDHHGAETLTALARLANEDGGAPHIGLLATNPYRVAFLPLDFEAPLLTDHTERLFGKHAGLWIGSAPRLLTELTDLAPALGIPLDDRQLTDDIATKINNFAPLYPNDDCALAEDQRTAWLLLYEGARLAVEHQVPMCLAG